MELVPATGPCDWSPRLVPATSPIVSELAIFALKSSRRDQLYFRKCILVRFIIFYFLFLEESKAFPPRFLLKDIFTSFLQL